MRCALTGKILLSVLYSIAEGFSFALAIDSSASGDDDNKTWALVLAGSMLLASTLSAGYFQGAAIRAIDIDEVEVEDEHLAQPDEERAQIFGSHQQLQQAPLARNGGVYQSFNLDNGAIAEQKTQKLVIMQPNTGCCTKLSSMVAPLYFCLVIGQYFVSRYYLFNRLFESFGGDAGSISFWVLLSITFLIKLLFGMGNEVLETLEGIAPEGGMIRGVKKFLNRLFASEGSINCLSAIGSLEHTLCDDLLPWVALLPDDAIAYIATTTSVFWSVIAGSVIFGLPLLGLVFLQTYLYEGHCLEHNLRMDRFDNPPLSHRNWVKFLKIMPGGPIKMIETISRCLIIMGPLHGSATVLPVYFSRRLSNPYARGILSPSIWSVTSLGTHYSEVKMAKKVLQTTKQELIAAIGLGAPGL